MRASDRMRLEEIADSDAYIVDQRADYPGQVRITGHTRSGRWLTIAAPTRTTTT